MRHHRFRRNKILFSSLAVIVAVYMTVLYYGQYSVGYIPLRPLFSAEAEARRLLKFVTSYHYQCNATYYPGKNRSHFPICTDNDTGVDIDSRGTMFSLWSPQEYEHYIEKDLAVNHSFEVYVVTRDPVPLDLYLTNHTHVIQTMLLPNDAHDFSRNSYGQRTYNDIMDQYQVDTVDILKIEMFSSSQVQTWEILHYLIEDNMVSNVKQLHITMRIDKLDDELLYYWYRCLYNLFHKQGMRLYHTEASSPLCVQVTMMESCVYWLAWIRDPGPHKFVMYPPTDFGDREVEEERLVTYVHTHHLRCHNLQSAVHPSVATVILPLDRSTGVCVDNLYDDDNTLSCQAVIISNHTDLTLDHTLKKSGCNVKYFSPEGFGNASAATVTANFKTVPMFEIAEYLTLQSKVDIVSIDYPGSEWAIVAFLLDSKAFTNVSQVLFVAHLTDVVYGQHPVVLRRMYSELHRIEKQGLHLFDSVPCVSHSDVRGKDISDCYKLGFMMSSKPSSVLKYYAITHLHHFN